MRQTDDSTSRRQRSFVERCWVLVGQQQAGVTLSRRVRPTRGEPASVSFDANWVLAREEQQGDVVGFYHTHPAGCAEPSDRDLRTMRAWVTAFGKPLLCLIESAGALAAWRFADAASEPRKEPIAVAFARGWVVVAQAPGATH